MELTFLAGDALDHDFRSLIDENAHIETPLGFLI
jgi:hypothetical protein